MGTIKGFALMVELTAGGPDNLFLRAAQHQEVVHVVSNEPARRHVPVQILLWLCDPAYSDYILIYCNCWFENTHRGCCHCIFREIQKERVSFARITR